MEITRFEVIDHRDSTIEELRGRRYVTQKSTPFKVRQQTEDDGRTLKIFLENGGGDE